MKKRIFAVLMAVVLVLTSGWAGSLLTKGANETNYQGYVKWHTEVDKTSVAPGDTVKFSIIIDEFVNTATEFCSDELFETYGFAAKDELTDIQGSGFKMPSSIFDKSSVKVTRVLAGISATGASYSKKDEVVGFVQTGVEIPNGATNVTIITVEAKINESITTNQEVSLGNPEEGMFLSGMGPDATDINFESRYTDNSKFTINAEKPVIKLNDGNLASGAKSSDAVKVTAENVDTLTVNDKAATSGVTFNTAGTYTVKATNRAGESTATFTIVDLASIEVTAPADQTFYAKEGNTLSLDGGTVTKVFSDQTNGDAEAITSANIFPTMPDLTQPGETTLTVSATGTKLDGSTVSADPKTFKVTVKSRENINKFESDAASAKALTDPAALKEALARLDYEYEALSADDKAEVSAQGNSDYAAVKSAVESNDKNKVASIEITAPADKTMYAKSTNTLDVSDGSIKTTTVGGTTSSTAVTDNDVSGQYDLASAGTYTLTVNKSVTNYDGTEVSAEPKTFKVTVKDRSAVDAYEQAAASAKDSISAGDIAALDAADKALDNQYNALSADDKAEVSSQAKDDHQAVKDALATARAGKVTSITITAPADQKFYSGNADTNALDLSSGKIVYTHEDGSTTEAAIQTSDLSEIPNLASAGTTNVKINKSYKNFDGSEVNASEASFNVEVVDTSEADSLALVINQVKDAVQNPSGPSPFDRTSMEHLAALDMIDSSVQNHYDSLSDDLKTYLAEKTSDPNVAASFDEFAQVYLLNAQVAVDADNDFKAETTSKYNLRLKISDSKDLTKITSEGANSLAAVKVEYLGLAFISDGNGKLEAVEFTDTLPANATSGSASPEEVAKANSNMNAKVSIDLASYDKDHGTALLAASNNEGLKLIVVDSEGNEIASEIADGKISFVADKAGVYTLVSVELTEEEKAAIEEEKNADSDSNSVVKAAAKIATGDTTPIALLIVLMVAALFAGCVAFFSKKRKSNR